MVEKDVSGTFLSIGGLSITGWNNVGSGGRSFLVSSNLREDQGIPPGKSFLGTWLGLDSLHFVNALDKLQWQLLPILGLVQALPLFLAGLISISCWGSERSVSLLVGSSVRVVLGDVLQFGILKDKDERGGHVYLPTGQHVHV